MTIIEASTQILVAADHQLVSKAFYRERVWKPARAAHQDVRSRAAWLSALTLLYDYDGRLYFRDGRPYHPQDVDEVFTDPDNRWMTNFLKADESGNSPASLSRMFERLRMIELYCRLLEEEEWRL